MNRHRKQLSIDPTTLTGLLGMWAMFMGLVLFSSPLLAVNCTPDSITLTSQAEVNSFQVDHGPGCDNIVGSLTISGASITDLTPLLGPVWWVPPRGPCWAPCGTRL